MKTTAQQRGSDEKSKAPKSEEGQEMDMANSALHELFISELKDIYWAEKYLVKNLPKMADKAHSGDLKSAITGHLKETENHVARLEEVFENLGVKAQAKKCDAMAGLVDEANETIGETEDDTAVRDVAIISCAQKVEHYEIATYGTLRTLAQIMGHTEVVELLSATLQEEKNADLKLSEIGLEHVNQDAISDRR